MYALYAPIQATYKESQSLKGPMVFVMLSMSMASAERISEVLNETPDLQNPDQPIFDVADGSVEFKNVAFAYRKDSDEPVLKGINLSVKAGETIGILGGTGSAKTSLVNLISRLYDVTQGQVLVAQGLHVVLPHVPASHQHLDRKSVV